MKYFIRSVKYFFHFAILTAVIITILILIGAVEGNINEIFEDGWNSLWKIGVFFALIAAVYPKFAFISRKLDTDADWDTVRSEAVNYFKERRFTIENEETDRISFRRTRLADRIAKKGEDRITLTRTADGCYLDGLRKEVFIFTTGLETALNR